MKPSQKAIDLIKEFEGCELEAYRCPAGIPTIGYGTTSEVEMGDRITQEQAEELLKRDVQFFGDAINELITVDVTQGQFDSLVVFTYNIGVAAFADSGVLRLLNEEKHQESGDRLLKWNKAGEVELEGLTRRRKAERKLFYSQKFLT